MRHPVISVIMGSYNPTEKEGLEDAVKSIIEQSYSDWEFIICDDGSDEPYATYLSDLSNLDDRIICIRNEENHGLAYSLNRCLDIAKGDFIARMDDDDISLPERFEKELEFLYKNPEYAWVGSEAALFDNNGRWGIGSRPEVPDENDYLRYSPFIHPSVMFRKNPLLKVHGYSEEKKALRCEDYELFMKLAAKGYKGYNIQEILFKYQENSHAYGKKKFRFYHYEKLVRAEGFKRMKIDFFKRLPYVYKPYAVACLSVSPENLQKIRKSRKADNHAVVYNEKGQDEKRKKQYLKNLRAYDIFHKAASDQLQKGFINTLEEKVDKLVLAPTLNAYIIWVLRQACEQGIESLYFLARDGYLMYKLACKYVEKFNLPIECRYLFCSRYSLRVPLYHKNIDEALDHVCRGGIEVTLRKILTRSGFTQEDIEKYAESSKTFIDKQIPYAALASYKDKLRADSEYMNLLKLRSEEAWPDTVEYFKQEGMFDGKRMALVDSGWTGTTQKTFCDIFKACGKSVDLKGFYFGLYEIPESNDIKDYFSFYFSPKGDLKNKVFFSNCLFEGVFSAPHGMTIEYQRQHDEIKPVLLETNRKTKKLIERIDYNINSYTDSLLEQMTDAAFKEFDFRQLKGMIYNQLKLFMYKPKALEAESYGRIQFSDDLLDSQMQDIATKLSRRELKQNHVFSKFLFMTGIKKGSVRESAWYEASAVRNSRISWWHRVNYAMYKALVYIRKNI